MSYKLKPDFEQTMKRFDAFWKRELIDRPPVSIALPVPEADRKPVPNKTYASDAERWLDIDFRAEEIAADLANYDYIGDSLPVAFPNMGPGIFSAWCGCGYSYGDTTTWTDPCINDWEKDGAKAVFDPKHPLYKKMIDFMNLLFEYGRGNFIVGFTDFHAGGDHIAAQRDTQNLAVDMIENTEYVKLQLERSYKDYFKVYDAFYDMIRREGMPMSTWAPIAFNGRFNIISCDFSCMIGTNMFNDVFLPGIQKECRHFDRTLYHLDGPGALRHLDSILEIKELHAVQWVCGAGREGYANWVEVYRKIQKAGKAIQLLFVRPEELSMVFGTLRPEGVWFSNMEGINDKSQAEEVIKRITNWR